MDTTLNISIEISKSPLNGFRRLATILSTYADYSDKQVIVSVRVDYLDNEGNLKESGEATHYHVDLIVNNENKVNERGEVVTQGGVWGEFDYYVAAINGGANFFDIQIQAIKGLDENGRFN